MYVCLCLPFVQEQPRFIQASWIDQHPLNPLWSFVPNVVGPLWWPPQWCFQWGGQLRESAIWYFKVGYIDSALISYNFDISYGKWHTCSRLYWVVLSFIWKLIGPICLSLLPEQNSTGSQFSCEGTEVLHPNHYTRAYTSTSPLFYLWHKYTAVDVKKVEKGCYHTNNLECLT